MILTCFVLTVIGWGIGELIGRWIVRGQYRRKVRKWLAAESVWKYAQLIDNILSTDIPMLPKKDNYYIERERRRAHAQQTFTSGCRPGMRCWQGCDNCSPRRAVGGYTNDLGEEINVYREYVGPGRARYMGYCNGMLIKQWDVNEAAGHRLVLDWETRRGAR